MNTHRTAEAFSDLAEAFGEIAVYLSDFAREISQRAYELMGPISQAYTACNAAPARWKHLALYGKTRRVRKKWCDKILRFYGDPPERKE